MLLLHLLLERNWKEGRERERERERVQKREEAVQATYEYLLATREKGELGFAGVAAI